MKTKESYITFIKNINNKVKYYSDELHFSISLCSTFYTSICNSKNEKITNYFKEIGFLNQFPPISEFGILSENDINIELQSTIHIYRSYIIYRIPYFEVMLSNYIFISSIPYEIYYDIITDYNFEISKSVLEGNTIMLSKLGKLFVLCQPTTNKKRILDNNKTRIQKQYFKDNNIVGDYRVYNTNDEFSMFVFDKNPIYGKLKYYHFCPTNYNNMVDRKIENYYKLNKTDEDILNNIKIGNVQKMNALIKQNLKYKLKYIQNAD
jgi:hypothetical protein